MVDHTLTVKKLSDHFILIALFELPYVGRRHPDISIEWLALRDKHEFGVFFFANLLKVDGMVLEDGGENHVGSWTLHDWVQHQAFYAIRPLGCSLQADSVPTQTMVTWKSNFRGRHVNWKFGDSCN